jgi:hypothetical protein
MKRLIIAASLFAAQTALAQTPQNPVACAQLRQALGKFIADSANNGKALAPDEIRDAIEIQRLTGHPCYLPPGVPQNPACVKLRQDIAQYAYNRGVHGSAPTQRELLQAMENRRLLGDPCFLPARR